MESTRTTKRLNSNVRSECGFWALGSDGGAKSAGSMYGRGSIAGLSDAYPKGADGLPFLVDTS